MHSDEQQADLATLTKLILEVRVGLLTTQDEQGRLHTRPVETLEVESGRTLWFFTDWSSPKVGEVERYSQASVGYADVSGHRFAAVSGPAHVLRDTGNPPPKLQNCARKPTFQVRP